MNVTAVLLWSFVVRSEHFAGLFAVITIDAQPICLFLLIVAGFHTEEDDWSDEFDDSAEEATPGFF